MKKIVIVLVCVVLLFFGIKEWMPQNVKEIITQKLAELQDDIEPLEGNIQEQLEHYGNYNIDEESWFDSDQEIRSGSQAYTTLDTGNITSLTVRAAGCTVEILPAEESGIGYSFEGMKKVQVSVTEQELEVKAIRDTGWNPEEENSVLTLYIPEGCSPEVMELELGAGILHAKKLQCGNLMLSVEAGKMTVDALKADNVEVSLGAGLVTLNQVEVGTAELSVGAGSLNVDGWIAENVEGQCAAGNLQLLLKGEQQDFNYEIQTVAGNIQIEDEKYSGLNESKNLEYGAQKKMKLNCAMGNIKVEYK